jgi:hypothetical protein
MICGIRVENDEPAGMCKEADVVYFKHLNGNIQEKHEKP